jgi:hypothetical protein
LELNYRPEDSMKALINLGVQGHFPLFLDQWINSPDVKERRFSKITGLERAKAKKLFNRVLKHRSLEHKKVVVFSMSDDERSLFIKAFFKLVEGKILDQRPELH